MLDRIRTGKKSEKYNQLMFAERCKIEAYRDEECSISRISRLLERSKSTIFYEIHQDYYNRKYHAQVAQDRSVLKRQGASKFVK